MTISNITALPPAPNRTDPTTFADKGDAMMTALVATFVPQMNTTINGINSAQAGADTDAATATSGASNANAAANTAASTAKASAWVSGSTYQLNDCAISQINFQTYRKKTTATTNTGGATDPANDVTNWTSLNPSTQMVRSARTSNTQLGVADAQKLIDVTSGTFSQTFGSAASLGLGWYCIVRNSGAGYITLAPAQTIDGISSVVMNPGEIRYVVCDGSVFYSLLINTEGYLHVREEKGAGTSAGDTVAQDPTQVRVLNTVKVNTINATLSTNVVTLPAGTYRTKIRVPFTYIPSGAVGYLWNNTDNSLILMGKPLAGTTGVNLDCWVSGQFTISATKNVTVRYYCPQVVSSGLGAAGVNSWTVNQPTGLVEVYTEAEFWKIA